MVSAGSNDIVMLYAEETGTGLPPSKMLAQRFDINGIAVYWVQWSGIRVDAQFSQLF